MIYSYLVSKEYPPKGQVQFDCESKELYYADYVGGNGFTKNSASLRNFRDLVKSLNGTKRTTAKFWSKPYYER